MDRLHEDQPRFESFLVELFEANPSGLEQRFRNDEFGYLISEMTKADMGALITRLMLGERSMTRKFGLVLFEKLKSPSLSQEVLESADEKRLRLLLYELICHPCVGSVTSKFFLFLATSYGDASAELRNEFETEMTHQAINYPGECLNTWKEISNPSGLVKKVIDSATKYFEKLDVTLSLPGNGLFFSEFDNVLRLGARVFFQQVSRGGKEKSPFAKLLKTF